MALPQATTVWLSTGKHIYRLTTFNTTLKHHLKHYIRLSP